MARSLNSICRARDEARYVSRTWSNPSSTPDRSYPIHINETTKSPDDLIPVWDKGEDGLLHKKMITRAQFDADFQAMLAKNREESSK
jgi:hypothetical protein